MHAFIKPKFAGHRYNSADATAQPVICSKIMEPSADIYAAKTQNVTYVEYVLY